MQRPHRPIAKGPAALVRLATASRRATLPALLTAAEATTLQCTLSELNRVSADAACQMADDLRQALRRPRGLAAGGLR